jgi:hypothetical protein
MNVFQMNDINPRIIGNMGKQLNKNIRGIILIKLYREKIFRSPAKKLSVVWKTITLSNSQK